MNLTKRLLSAGLGALTLFSGVNCFCAEPEKDQKASLVSKKPENSKSKAAFTASALLNITLMALLAKQYKDSRHRNNAAVDDSNRRTPEPDLSLGGGNDDDDDDHGNGGAPSRPASPMPEEKTNAPFYNGITDEEAKRRLGDWECATRVAFEKDSGVFDCPQMEAVDHSGDITIAGLVGYLFDSCAKAEQTAWQAKKDAASEQANDTRVANAEREVTRVKAEKEEIWRELFDLRKSREDRLHEAEASRDTYRADAERLAVQLRGSEDTLARVTLERNRLTSERDRLNRTIEELRARPIGSADYDMYVSKLRLTEAMMQKAKRDFSEAEGEPAKKLAKTTCSILATCREYLIMKILSLRSQGLLPGEQARLTELEAKVNELRENFYADGDPEAGRDDSLPFLVLCHISHAYYLPVDVQYCGKMCVDESGNITVHGVSDLSVASWVGHDPRKAHRCVDNCEMVPNYFVPAAH